MKCRREKGHRSAEPESGRVAASCSWLTGHFEYEWGTRADRMSGLRAGERPSDLHILSVLGGRLRLVVTSLCAPYVVSQTGSTDQSMFNFFC